MFSPGFHVLSTLLTEFRRAQAAERRYEGLMRLAPTALAADGLSTAGIPRRIFEEFYAARNETKDAARSTPPQRATVTQVSA